MALAPRAVSAFACELPGHFLCVYRPRSALPAVDHDAAGLGWLVRTLLRVSRAWSDDSATLMPLTRQGVAEVVPRQIIALDGTPEAVRIEGASRDSPILILRTKRGSTEALSRLKTELDGTIEDVRVEGASQCCASSAAVREEVTAFEGAMHERDAAGVLVFEALTRAELKERAVHAWEFLRRKELLEGFRGMWGIAIVEACEEAEWLALTSAERARLDRLYTGVFDVPPDTDSVVEWLVGLDARPLSTMIQDRWLHDQPAAPSFSRFTSTRPGEPDRRGPLLDPPVFEVAVSESVRVTCSNNTDSDIWLVPAISQYVGSRDEVYPVAGSWKVFERPVMIPADRSVSWAGWTADDPEDDDMLFVAVTVEPVGLTVGAELTATLLEPLNPVAAARFILLFRAAGPAIPTSRVGS